ncbi:MAG: DinB family protein [Acidobacteriota bacterium]
MNEYVAKALARLSGRDPVEVLSTTPSRLEDTFWELGPRGLDRSYGEGKWTARQLFAHLADVEIVYGFRLRLALAETKPTVQVMDQDAWVKSTGTGDTSLAIELFRALRLWNLELIRSLSPDDRAREMDHPERGVETVDLLVSLMAAHDLGHLEQLAAVPRG